LVKPNSSEKGKNVVPGIYRSAEQYGLRDRFLDCINFDITNGPWRRGGFVDAIVTDPPYGVRAGAKRIGKSAGRKRNVLRDEPFQFDDGTYAHQ
jgi:tRNA (guanine10-N2)-methyltransferase